MSRFWLVILSGCLIACSVAAAQEPPGGQASLRVLAVELTEVVAQNGGDEIASRLSGTEAFREAVRKLEQEGKIQVLQRVTLTVLENNQTEVRFAQRVPVVTGTAAAPGRGPVRQVHYEQVGTLVRVTARMQGDDAVLALAYEGSRQLPQEPDSPAALATVRAESTLKLKLGQSVLVTSASAEGRTTLLVASVSLWKPGRSGATGRGAASPTPTTRSGGDGRHRTTDTEARTRIARYCESLIPRHDKNGDGVLQRDEAANMRVGARFDEIDADHNGVVTKDELVDLLLRRASPKR